MGIEVTTPASLGDVVRPDPALTVYRNLIRDGRISHGAFREWHYLRDRKNKHGQCWPSVRTIASELHCKTSSVTGWTKELVEAGYLSVERSGQKHHYRYTVLTGNEMQSVSPEQDTREEVSASVQPSPVSPIGDTPRVAQTGHTTKISRIPFSSVVSPIGDTPRVAPLGDISNISEVISKANPLNRGKLASNGEGLKLMPAGEVLMELMPMVREVLGKDEWKTNHARWYDRADREPDKLRRVLADTRIHNLEGGIATTPAQFAEDLWKLFT